MGLEFGFVEFCVILYIYTITPTTVAGVKRLAASVTL